MRRAPAIVRRLLPHRLALAAAAATVMLAATLLAALASFSATISSHAVRATLAGNPAATISVTSSADSAAAAARADRRLRASLRRALAGVPVTIWTALSSDYLDLPPGLGLPHAQTHVISLPALPGHAALLAGSWPGGVQGGTAGGSGRVGTPQGGTVPVAAPESLARGLHLAAGMTIRLRDGVTGTVIPVRITGIFGPRRPRSPYWLFGSAAPGAAQAGGFSVYGPLVTTPAAVAAGRVPVTTQAWAAVPDAARFGAGGLQAMASRLQSALAGLGATAGLSNQTVSTGLPGLLSGLGTALVVARSQLAIGAAILLVIAGATLALATVMLSAQRQGEAALLRSRGASRWQVAGSGLAETGLLILPAVVAGPLLGGLLLPPLATHGPLSRSGLRLAVAFPPAAWLAAAAVAAGCAVVIALPWLRAGRGGSEGSSARAAAAGSPVRERAQRGRRGAVAAASRAGADVALLVLAGLAVWQLEYYAAPVSVGLDGAIGVDPVLVLAPVLALAAGAAALLRLLPLMVRVGDRAAGRGRDLTAAVAAWQISRRPLRQAGPVLLAVMAVATTVLAVAQWSSWQRSAQDQASFATGADERVTLAPQAPLAAGQVASLTAAAGVSGATPVIRSPIVLSGSGTATLLALDAAQARSVAAIRPDLAGGSPASLLRRLAPPGRPPGAPVPGRPARLLITASLSARSVTQAVLLADVTDAFGVTYQVQAGVLPADGRAHALAVTIAARNGAAYPLRITGFALQYLMPAGPAPDAALRIASVRGAATMDGRFGAPFAAAPASGAMAFSENSGSGQVGAPPRVLRATPRGTSLLVEFAPGSGVSPASFGSPASPLPAAVTISARGPAGPLAAAVTSAFAAATGQGPGSRFPVSLGGVSVPVIVAAVIGGFPTIGGPGGGVVVDQSWLQQALAAAGARPLPVTEWWLRTGAGAPAPALPGGAVLADRAAIAASLLASPLSAAPQLSMLAIAAAAVILAAAGFGVAAATAGERARDLALLATLGATRRQLTRVLCLEQAALGLPAAGAGLALGVLLARLVVPAVTLTATGAHPQPPVLVQVPLAVPVAVAVVTAAIPVAIAAAGPARRAGLAARTRLEAQT